MNWIVRLTELLAIAQDWWDKRMGGGGTLPKPDDAPPAAEDSAYDMTLRVTKLTSRAVYFDWTPKKYNWPEKTVKVRVDAVVEMRRADGSGGKFDWIRAGGQSSKGLENIHRGYGGHTVPASGERVTFRWVSVDGKRRSNDAEAVWP